jgi:phosphatidylethanolamine/phosphatidyl-N-methylethanolamine N-methyltransferase
MVLELNEELHHHLRRRFPDAQVVCGDACDLPNLVQRTGFGEGGPVDAVISGLGLLSMPKPTQRAIVAAAFDTLRPEGRLIQFTYGPASPVSKEVIEALDLNARRGNFAWWNMPPATVYVYSRNRSKAVKARSMR